MKQMLKLIQRMGGPTLLVVLAVLVFVGWRTSAALSGDTAVFEDAASTMTTAATTTPRPGQTAVPTLPFSPDSVPVITDDALAPAPVPLTYQGQIPDLEFATYVVERGDTPRGIAERFGIQPETLLGGNPQLSEESSLLQTGVELIILPTDGVLHDVQPGETLDDIANQYAVPVEEIIAYEPNNLEFPYRLYPETQILVPGAVRELFVWTPPDLSSVGGTSWEGADVRPIIVGTGTFLYPVNSRNYTQYYWFGHRGLDIALPEGSSVTASDTGTVTYAGWNNFGYGNLIVVNHGNGHETFYAHLSGINVVPGQIVYQGNVIGASGNTGNSSGPHIHFEIRLNGNQDDPCWYLGC